MYRYQKVNIDDIETVNELGLNGYKVIATTNDYILMEQEYNPAITLDTIDLMPVQRTIKDPNALYKCQPKIKRYTYSDQTEPTTFITIDDFKSHNFYADEYEAYLSDGFYFIGTNISKLTTNEIDTFIEQYRHMFKETIELKIYFIDYPEDK